jgi:hypothetical protein
VFDSVGMCDWVIDGKTVDNAAAIKRIISLYEARESTRVTLQAGVEQANRQIREAFSRLLSDKIHRNGIR